MTTKVHITEIAGAPIEDFYLPFTVRGHHKGNRAKATKCFYCNEMIEIGEQYFAFNFGTAVCLGCVEYE